MGLTRSWLDSANDADCPFPLNNLPCGVFSSASQPPRCGVAIGDCVLDVVGLEQAGLLALDGGPLLDVPEWNRLMAAGPAVWRVFRARLTELLAEGAAARGAVEPYLVSLAAVTLHLPFRVSEYTDFYASRDHATNVGTMFRGADNALPPNWLHIPIGYNGRASSVVVSGTPVRRPWGQVKGAEHAVP
jgi:fumarylacetoacetase